MNTSKKNKALFSGIQPTGEIHIGNYLGALKNWVDLQNQYQCYFSIVDLHAITIDYDPKNYQEKILDTAMDLLAIGIDPKKSNFFIQSHVPEHTELCWLFNTLIPIAELERMTQFKEKANQNKKNINAGLFDYPVLMAADILLYHAEVVPVGEDQLQHLELANTIVRKFNNKFGNYFKEIKPIISSGARIMSLADPTKKMSKSLGPNHYIAINDSPETIKKKVMGAVTDVGPQATSFLAAKPSDNKFDFLKSGNLESEKNYKNLGRGFATKNQIGKSLATKSQMSAGVKNLFTLMELLADTKTFQKFQKAYDNKNIKYSELKAELAEVIIKQLHPLQEKKKYWLKNKSKVQKILNDGTAKAKKVAQKNILEIKERMGLTG